MMKKPIVAIAALTALLAGSTGVRADRPEGNDTGASAIATFAGGCFWCMEAPFDKVEGVLATTSGYTGGFKKDPTYKEVCTGTTGHCESLEVRYDPMKVTYADLLEVYWRNIDPTTSDREFCDVGNQYRPAIFYHDAEQKRLAEASREVLRKSGKFKKVAVEITEATTFYPAEDYHQDFYKKDPERYHSYRTGCGRDRRLKELWSDWEGIQIVPHQSVQ